MNEKDISRKELADMLNINEYRLIRFFNADTHMDIFTIRKIETLLGVSENCLLKENENKNYNIFENDDEKEKYYKWLKEDNIRIRNKRVNFDSMYKKRLFNPNL